VATGPTGEASQAAAGRSAGPMPDVLSTRFGGGDDNALLAGLLQALRLGQAGKGAVSGLSQPSGVSGGGLDEFGRSLGVDPFDIGKLSPDDLRTLMTSGVLSTGETTPEALSLGVQRLTGLGEESLPNLHVELGQSLGREALDPANFSLTETAAPAASTGTNLATSGLQTAGGLYALLQGLFEGGEPTPNMALGAANAALGAAALAGALPSTAASGIGAAVSIPMIAGSLEEMFDQPSKAWLTHPQRLVENLTASNQANEWLAQALATASPEQVPGLMQQFRDRLMAVNKGVLDESWGPDVLNIGSEVGAGGSEHDASLFINYNPILQALRDEEALALQGADPMARVAGFGPAIQEFQFESSHGGATPQQFEAIGGQPGQSYADFIAQIQAAQQAQAYQPDMAGGG
jgi:hypothetical protein